MDGLPFAVYVVVYHSHVTYVGHRYKVCPYFKLVFLSICTVKGLRLFQVVAFFNCSSYRPVFLFSDKLGCAEKWVDFSLAILGFVRRLDENRIWVHRLTAIG